MFKERNKSPKDKRGGGRKAAALFCLISTAAVLTAMVAIHVFLGPRDRTAGLVPRDAIIYVHAQGRTSVSKISGVVPFIPETRANEIGIFSLELEEGRVWTAALMWSRLLPPSESELESLEFAGAIRVSPTFYLLRTGEGPIILSEGWNGSLTDDPETDRALSSMRSVSRIQGYLDTDALLSGTGLLPAVPEDIGPVVLSLTGEANEPAAAIVRVSEAASYPAILGFRLPEDHLAEPVPGPIEADRSGPSISFMTDRNYLNPVPLLFHEIEQLRLEAGIPESHQLQTARDIIAAYFSGPVSLTVWPGKQPVPFIAYLPDAEATGLDRDMLGFLSASFPMERKISLPDGSKAIEYIVEPGLYKIPEDGGGPEDDPRTMLPIVAAGDSAGTYVASDVQTMKLIRNPAAQESAAAGCVPGNWPTLTVRDIAGIIPTDSLIAEFIELISLKTAVIQRIGDNITYFCGY